MWDRGFTWTFGDFPEHHALIEWMREFNQRSPNRKVRFYGMDVAGAKGSWRDAAEQVMSYLDRVEPAFAKEFRPRLTALYTKFEQQGRTDAEFVAANEAFKKLPQADRDAVDACANELADRFESLRIIYIAASSLEDYEWARQIALSLRWSAALMVNYEAKDRPNHTWNARDANMAINVEWMRKRGAVDGGVVVLAHNGHVQNAISPLVEPNMASTGMFLRSKLGDGYRNIGFTFGSGSFWDGKKTSPLPQADADTLDGALSRVGEPLFVVNLHEAPAAARQWLETPRKLRFVNLNVPYDQLKSWDGLIYIDRITPWLGAP
jgi:erythromycin esterase